jgi:hypothetical protein
LPVQFYRLFVMCAIPVEGARAFRAADLDVRFVVVGVGAGERLTGMTPEFAAVDDHHVVVSVEGQQIQVGSTGDDSARGDCSALGGYIPDEPQPRGALGRSLAVT